ncbi:MAG: trehalose-6-phosphate synthase [Actinobacteria bacterium]|nr:trehalose-6-phosphate synthase [Actinomycetota bacterium]
MIIVSNRGPVTYDRDASGERIERRGGGGLVTALRGLLEHHDVTWIASATTEEDRVVAGEGGGDVVLVAHDAAAYEGYYNVIANPLLWFVQHSLYGLASEPDVDRAMHGAWRDGYAVVNRAFADAVVAELDNKPDATVFFHDYHLYLAPRMVRELRPDARLAHFVHIPWPEDWSALPPAMRDAITDGLLANDVVAFHTERWARNFTAGAGALGRTTVVHHPISIDVGEFDELAASDGVRRREEQLWPGRPEKLVVRVDRTDPSKNIVRGFRAFGLLLEEHREWRGRVSMLALLDPSRQSIPVYADYLATIERVASAVNERFGEEGWRPVELRVADDFLQSVAAYKQYDVLLVNPVYDGLNLVAKEGPLVNLRAGVLVLSENAGAYEELSSWAVGVNPFDLAGQADALHEALSMGEAERQARAEGLREHVRMNDVRQWIEALLADFDQAAARDYGVSARR